MITKQMKMHEILENDKMCEVLIAHGLNCQGCPGAQSETLEEAAKGHNVNFCKLLADLNARIEE